MSCFNWDSSDSSSLLQLLYFGHTLSWLSAANTP